MTADRMATPARSVLLYADINLGAIGGASVWLATMAELLASAGCEVTLPLRGRRLPEMPLLRPLEDRPGIRIVEPSAKEDMSHRGMAVRLPAAVAMLKRLDAREPFDVLVVRGMPLATLLAAEPRIPGPHVDIPDRHPAVGGRDRPVEAGADGRHRPRLAGRALPDRGAAVVPRVDRAGQRRSNGVTAPGRADAAGGRHAAARRHTRPADPPGLFRQVRAALEHPRDDAHPGPARGDAASPAS